MKQCIAIKVNGGSLWLFDDVQTGGYLKIEDITIHGATNYQIGFGFETITSYPQNGQQFYVSAINGSLPVFNCACDESDYVYVQLKNIQFSEDGINWRYINELDTVVNGEGMDHYNVDYIWIDDIIEDPINNLFNMKVKKIKTQDGYIYPVSVTPAIKDFNFRDENNNSLTQAEINLLLKAKIEQLEELIAQMHPEIPTVTYTYSLKDNSVTYSPEELTYDATQVIISYTVVKTGSDESEQEISRNKTITWEQSDEEKTISGTFTDDTYSDVSINYSIVKPENPDVVILSLSSENSTAEFNASAVGSRSISDEEVINWLNSVANE